MAGNPRPASDHRTLRPPPPPARSRPGYGWAAGLVGAVLIVAMFLVGFDFFGVPGVDPVRAGGWYFVISLMVLIPAAFVVLLLSWGVVAVLRATGARTWPGIVQAAPSVALVLGLLYLLVRWLFSGSDTG
jgi:hypothetical protein